MPGRRASTFCARSRSQCPEMLFSDADLFGNSWNDRTLDRVSTWGSSGLGEPAGRIRGTLPGPKTFHCPSRCRVRTLLGEAQLGKNCLCLMACRIICVAYEFCAFLQIIISLSIKSPLTDKTRIVLKSFVKVPCCDLEVDSGSEVRVG